MFFHKSQSPEVRIDKSDMLLMVKCFVKSKMTSKMQCVIESDESILIGDIVHMKNRDYNKGYGSIMMDKLLSYATEYGYTTIHGNLSIIDTDHKERLHHFYEKFGFTITEYPKNRDCYYGEIQKILTEVNI
ncbi:hypothetical protein A4S06_00015 [Erysipelotrichaceae bacterium MTC7]|nr:hypothetical protein A4S06_00015 [Erysipelotrichaceae bacterium MTC7]